MTAIKQPTPFQIIRHRGTPDRAQLPDGRWVYGQSKFWIDMYDGFVPVAPYSDHFIYEMPKDVRGPVFICSCGSFAEVVGATGYVLDASPQGKMIVCHAHASTGRHVNGGARWV